MQDAATSWQEMRERKTMQGIADLTVKVIHGEAHVEPMKPCRCCAHCSCRSESARSITFAKQRMHITHRTNDEPKRNRNSTPRARSYISFSREHVEGVFSRSNKLKSHWFWLSEDIVKKRVDSHDQIQIGVTSASDGPTTCPAIRWSRANACSPLYIFSSTTNYTASKKLKSVLSAYSSFFSRASPNFHDWCPYAADLGRFSAVRNDRFANACP